MHSVIASQEFPGEKTKLYMMIEEIYQTIEMRLTEY